jgi:hypothetical protein
VVERNVLKTTLLCLAMLSASACTTADSGPEAAGNDSGANIGQLDAGAPAISGEASSTDGGVAASGFRDAATDAATTVGPSPADVGVDANAVEAGTRVDDAATAPDAARGDAGDATTIAAALHGLFLDVPCAASTPTPLAQGATCTHPSGTQHIEKAVTIAGEPGTIYAIELRVRGVWEPTLIQGGQRPDAELPLTVGGMPPAGTGSSDPINYQQYSLQVSEPKQTYWLNDYQYVAHDIHKEDYQLTLRAAGGARVLAIMNDGNDRQIANFPKSSFSDLAPYDEMPSIGQWMRLDVVKVTREAR